MDINDFPHLNVKQQSEINIKEDQISNMTSAIQESTLKELRLKTLYHAVGVAMDNQVATTTGLYEQRDILMNQLKKLYYEASDQEFGIKSEPKNHDDVQLQNLKDAMDEE